MKLLVSPHCDDEALFCSFTLLREKPLVLIVFDGCVQQDRGLDVTWQQRRSETEAACEILGVGVQFMAFRDNDASVRPEIRAQEIRDRLFWFNPTEVYAPAPEHDGHPHHNLVAQACDGLPIAERYLTYTTRGKSTSAHPTGVPAGRPVPILDGSWIALKHRALACYESQMSLDPRMGCYPHFLRDMTEYYA